MPSDESSSEDDSKCKLLPTSLKQYMHDKRLSAEGVAPPAPTPPPSQPAVAPRSSSSCLVSPDQGPVDIYEPRSHREPVNKAPPRLQTGDAANVQRGEALSILRAGEPPPSEAKEPGEYRLEGQHADILSHVVMAE